MTNEHDDERQALITALYVVIAMFAVMSLVVSSVDGADYTVRVESPSRYTVTVETPKESHDERETVLMFFAPFKCDACDQQQADTKDWKDAPFKLKRGDNNKSPVKLDAFPVTAWQVKGRWWSYEGWYGREHLEKEWRRSREKTQAIGQETTHRTSRSVSTNISANRTQRLRNFAVSYRGRTTEVQGMTYRQHLTDNRQGFTANELAGLSEYELERLHSACHHYGVNAAWLRSYAERHGW